MELKFGYNDVYDGLTSPKQKKLAKKLSSKKQRVFKEEDDDIE